VDAVLLAGLAEAAGDRPASPGMLVTELAAAIGDRDGWPAGPGASGAGPAAGHDDLATVPVSLGREAPGETPAPARGHGLARLARGWRR
jgi:hypothetical protein